jgi:hypothetical protein
LHRCPAVRPGKHGVVRRESTCGRNEDHLDSLDRSPFGISHLYDQGRRKIPADGIYLIVAGDSLDERGLSGAGQHQLVATAGLESQERKAHNDS